MRAPIPYALEILPGRVGQVLSSRAGETKRHGQCSVPPTVGRIPLRRGCFRRGRVLLASKDGGVFPYSAV